MRDLEQLGPPEPIEPLGLLVPKDMETLVDFMGGAHLTQDEIKSIRVVEGSLDMIVAAAPDIQTCAEGCYVVLHVWRSSAQGSFDVNLIDMVDAPLVSFKVCMDEVACIPRGSARSIARKRRIRDAVGPIMLPSPFRDLLVESLRCGIRCGLGMLIPCVRGLSPDNPLVGTVAHRCVRGLSSDNPVVGIVAHQIERSARYWQNGPFAGMFDVYVADVVRLDRVVVRTAPIISYHVSSGSVASEPGVFRHLYILCADGSIYYGSKMQCHEGIPVMRT